MVKDNKQTLSQKKSMPCVDKEDDKLILKGYTFKKKNQVMSSGNVQQQASQLPQLDYQTSVLKSINQSNTILDDRILQKSGSENLNQKNFCKDDNKVGKKQNPLLQQNIILKQKGKGKENQCKTEDNNLKLKGNQMQDREKQDSKINTNKPKKQKSPPKLQNTLIAKKFSSQNKQVSNLSQHKQEIKQRSQGLVKRQSRIQFFKNKELLSNVKKDGLLQNDSQKIQQNKENEEKDDIVLVKKGYALKNVASLETNWSQNRQNFYNKSATIQFQNNTKPVNEIINKVLPNLITQKEDKTLLNAFYNFQTDQSKQQIVDFEKLIKENQLKISSQKQAIIEMQEEIIRSIMKETHFKKLIYYFRYDRLNRQMSSLAFQRMLTINIKTQTHQSLPKQQELIISKNVLIFHHNSSKIISLPIHSCFINSINDPRIKRR